MLHACPFGGPLLRFSDAPCLSPGGTPGSLASRALRHTTPESPVVELPFRHSNYYHLNLSIHDHLQVAC